MRVHVTAWRHVMSWKLRKENVRLAVTRFAPDPTPVAGLTDEQRAAHHAQRERECAKVEPALELSVPFDMAPGTEDLGALDLPDNDFKEFYDECRSLYHPYG